MKFRFFQTINELIKYESQCCLLYFLFFMQEQLVFLIPDTILDYFANCSALFQAHRFLFSFVLWKQYHSNLVKAS